MSEQKSCFKETADNYMQYIRACVSAFPPRYREDLIQEGFLGLYQACRAYDNSKGVPFGGFARVCIRNQIRSGYRQMRKNENDIDISLFENIACTDRGIDADSAVIKDFFSGLRAKLTDTEREVLDEYLKDLSYEDIASKLGITVKKVDNALYRIKNKIRNEYDI